MNPRVTLKEFSPHGRNTNGEYNFFWQIWMKKDSHWITELWAFISWGIKENHFKNWDIIHYTVKFSIWKYRSQWFLAYSQSCAIITDVQFRNIFNSPKRNSVYNSSHLPFSSLLQLLATTNQLSVSTYLPILDILHKWNHTISGLCWASFTYHVFKVHPCICQKSIPLCGQIFNYMNLSPFFSLFIHSSVERHLDYFHFLAVTKNAAMNIQVQSCVDICF